MKLAACSMAQRLELPSPAPVDSVLDAAEWSTGVFQQGPNPVRGSQEGHDSGDDSDSETESEN